MDKMTIHRGLSELKIIDSRIERAISEIEPVGLQQKDKLVNGRFEKNEFEESAKSKYQSIIDLIGRKNKIKSAIVKVNGETMVEINEQEMSIADAITFRSIIEMKKSLISHLKSSNTQNIGQMNKGNEEVRQNADRLAEAALGKDGSKTEDATTITEPYIEKNELKLVDPLGVDKLVEKLQDEVDSFESEIDATLSEINATTFIEV